MNLTYLVLGIGLILLGIIGVRSSRRGPRVPPQVGEKAKSSPLGALGMFFLGLGLVLTFIGL